MRAYDPKLIVEAEKIDPAAARMILKKLSPSLKKWADLDPIKWQNSNPVISHERLFKSDQRSQMPKQIHGVGVDPTFVSPAATWIRMIVSEF